MQKKTNEILDKELENIPFVRIGSYKGANIPIHFKCKICADVKLRRPSAVISNKHKCLSCFNTSRTRTSEDFDLKLNNINITRVEPYINSYTKIKFKCNKNHVWKTTPGHILNSKTGCPECNNISKRSSNVDYDKKLLEIEPPIARLDNYINSMTPIKHECSRGHVWAARPSNILSGRGCPYCVEKFGFKLNEPAILYYIKITKQDIVKFKIGVTNSSVEIRFSRDKDKKIDILWYKIFSTGKEAIEAEKYILNNSPEPRITDLNFLNSNGNTELFNADIVLWIKQVYD